MIFCKKRKFVKKIKRAAQILGLSGSFFCFFALFWYNLHINFENEAEKFVKNFI